MTDKPETPMQKALRLKNEALAAKRAPPGLGQHGGERAAAHASNAKSKPWMKK
jgi:hypothetical protein